MEEIIDGLWLGNKTDAKRAYYHVPREIDRILCVHEDLPNNTWGQKWIPIANVAYTGVERGYDVVGINMDRLNEACDFIENALSRGQSILTHCVAGLERSPLTVCWYLYTRKHFATLHDAYQHVMKIRPIVQDRTYWLPESVRLEMLGVTGASADNNAKNN